MRIAVVGATGRIGAKLTDKLLAKRHAVKALSRGGAALDALVAKGAEPFPGSFDTGAGDPFLLRKARPSRRPFFRMSRSSIIRVRSRFDCPISASVPA